MKVYNSRISFLIENLIIAIFSIYFFLWSQSLFFFDERLILVLLIPLYFFIKTDHLDKYSFFFFLILISLILFHLILNNFFFDKGLFENLDAVLGSTLIALIAIMYRSFLIKNLSKVIYFFISILVLFFFIEIFFFNNLYSINNFDCLNGWFSNVNLKLFSENSHFGMIAPAVICYMIFKKEQKKILNYLSLILIIFLFLFLSTTLLIGIILCLLIFIFTKFKIFNSFQKITSLSLLIACVILVFSKPQCNMRLSETVQGIYINYISKSKENPNLKEEWKKSLYNGSLNQSSEVTLNSYSVSLNSLKNYPFGVGINNYIVSYRKFSEELSLSTWDVNKEDGSNNFSKLLSEFGLFSFVLFLIIFNYALRDNEDFFNNTFFYSIIITQLLRGAGYFNGGFLLSLFIILLSLFLKKNNVKKIS